MTAGIPPRNAARSIANRVGAVRRAWPGGIGKVYLALVLGAVFFAVAVLNFHQMGRDHRSTSFLMRTSDWAAKQIETELLRFRAAVDRRLAGFEDATPEQANLSFDILWSRIPVASAGPEAQWFRALPGAEIALRDLRETLERRDALVRTVAAADPVALRALSDEIGVFVKIFRDLSVALHVGGQQRDAKRRVAAIQFGSLIALTALIVVGGSIVVLLLFAIRGNWRAAERERALRQMAEESSLAKSRFLASMSHELRTPLNAILGFADMISLQYLGPVGDRRYVCYAEDIAFSGRHLLDLVNQTLDIERIAAGKFVLAREPVHLPELLDQCERLLRQRADDKNVQLTSDVSDELPALDADRRAIFQVLINVVSNAIKFTPPGGDVSMTAHSMNGHNVVAVRDTGVGIPADRLATVMEPFSRHDSDPHKSQDGIGLGLSISNYLVELHGGALVIESEVGKGTTVTLTLPTAPV